tara:strand:- start:453 stop:1211 length:759 start_codon:yes stop_codon:yes gene_type:complete
LAKNDYGIDVYDVKFKGGIQLVGNVIYNFACVCYGDKYPVEYVQKLYNMVTRNTNLLINFYVFTDHVKMNKMLEGGRLYVKQFPEHDLVGWWNKLQLFHPNTYLPGITLYMDLDVVITGNIDCFYTHEPQLDFCGMNDFNPVSGVWNSSIMRFKQQDLHGRIWHKFMDDRPGYLRKFPGDQNLISDFLLNTPGTSSFPDSWTQSYKWYDRSGTRFSKQTWTYEHNGESLVTVFHGQPNPHESDMEWIKNAWK